MSKCLNHTPQTLTAFLVVVSNTKNITTFGIELCYIWVDLSVTLYIPMKTLLTDPLARRTCASTYADAFLRYLTGQFVGQAAGYSV